MKTVYLDCRDMTTREDLHACLARELEFPLWYGRNLDALFDLLCGLGPTRLVLRRTRSLDALGPYGGAVLETLRDAQRCNPGLALELED